ncbi:hypothetical protein D3H65_05530 [Paraflavitalea soli]|uniref:Uncharacterized protein n=1 Tax=Paraflavitalea soli TaxID=2315862 RepID=A0A3B7MGZ3_9BACT|nr:hypothetical protein [Paraflavitalea soli]AXY73468.1 hypothetical protein D3H65_05530 [Paraflavitalea soli]
MSTNGLPAADGKTKPAAPPAPKGYAKWFDVEFKNIIFDPSILHRKEAIEGYYIGFITAYNVIKGKKYSVLFEWTEVPSREANQKDFTLHVYVTPPPTVLKAGAQTLSANLALSARDDGSSGQIDPPTPPPPPPPTM